MFGGVASRAPPRCACARPVFTRKRRVGRAPNVECAGSPRQAFGNQALLGRSSGKARQVQASCWRAPSSAFAVFASV
eukprot:11186430-Lingulodinium_polyedra.AAC.1